VLANVRRESPGKVLWRISSLSGNNAAFHKFDVAPGGVTELTCVVVGESLPVEAIAGKLVPLFAGNFAGLASDAEG
jgi:hypothetical protein